MTFPLDTLALVAILLADACAIMAVAGIGQAVAGYFAARRFEASVRTAPAWRGERPGVTVLKPLHGNEPLLEEALASVCRQAYPQFQIVFGVQRSDDPALDVVARLQRRFPEVDIALVIDATVHGENRKIGNLANMLPQARHDVLVISDSDVHVGTDWIERIVAELAVPDTGLVTTIYTGVASNETLPAVLGASWITHQFMPGALMSRALGRQDCLGATMALRRETLAAIGGFAALAPHLADDHVLGVRVRALGLGIRLAPVTTATTVPETRMGDLFQHELRWSRTVLALVPGAFALSSMQYPFFWAALAVGLSGGAHWAIWLALGGWLARALCAHGIDRLLKRIDAGLASPAPIWLMPVRDLFSMAVFLASYAGDRVEWRGRTMSTGREASRETAAMTPPVYGSQTYPARGDAPVIT